MDSVNKLLRNTELSLDLDVQIQIYALDNLQVTTHITESDDDKTDNQMSYDVSSCSDIRQLTRFGELIGINKSICWCGVGLYTFLDRPINAESHQCLQSIYRGIESNTSITSITLELECFGIGNQVNNSLPRFNFQNSQIKSNLKGLCFHNSGHITLTVHDSVVIAEVLEEMASLEYLNIHHLATSASAFGRLISAFPPTVERLYISCDTADHCSTLVTFLQANGSTNFLSVQKANRSLIVTGEEVYRESENLKEEEASTIINGLKNGNVMLESLYMKCCIGNTYFTSVQNLLCDISSIDSIHSSNHTLLVLMPSPKSEGTTLIEDCLRLNANPNKGMVIREKIARFYFVGDFDVSPLSNLHISSLPTVLAMIKGNDVYCQSAIFRLLKSIPDLCNVGSRVKIVSNDDDDDDDDDDIKVAKFGACGNKRRRKT